MADVHDMITRLLDDEKGAYMAFDEEIWAAIACLSESMKLSYSEVLSLAIKRGLCILIDEV